MSIYVLNKYMCAGSTVEAYGESKRYYFPITLTFGTGLP